MRIVMPFLVSALLFLACNKKDGGGGGGGGAAETPAPATEPAPAPADGATPGTLAIVTGVILPADGAAASTAAGARVAAEGRPEISAVTGEDGKFTVENVLPGTVSLYVASNDGIALDGAKGVGPSAFGLKISDLVLKNGEVTDLGQQTMKKTGGLSGKVLFYSNPNSLDLTGSEVFVPGTGFIAKTDAAGSFTLPGLPPGKYDLRAQHTGFSVLDLTDVEVLEGQTIDLGSVTLSISTGPEGKLTITEDLKADIGAKQGAKIVKSRIVKMQLSYDGDAALMKIADEPSFTNKEWVPVKPDFDWEFTSDGLKALYVMYSDLNGLESSPYRDEAFVDTEAPTLDSIFVLRDWVESAQRDVDVDIVANDSGSGVAKVILSNEAAPTSSSPALPYASRLDWQLSAGADGSRDVYAKVVDFAGNESVVRHDPINKGQFSKVTEKDYGETLVFPEKFSPYLLVGTGTDFTFDDDVVLEAGVRLEVGVAGGPVGRGVYFNGKVTANGTAAKPVVFRSTAADAKCEGDLFFDRAVAGVSEKNLLKHVTFRNLSNVYLNGGVIEDSQFTFDNEGGTLCTNGHGGATDRHGSLIKNADELLVIKNPTFQNWYTGMNVNSGSGTVRVQGGSGTTERVLVQNVATSSVEFIGPATFTYPSGGYIQNTSFSLQQGQLSLKDLTVNGQFNAGGPNGSVGLEVGSSFAGSLTLDNVVFDTSHIGIKFASNFAHTAALDGLTFDDVFVALSLTGNRHIVATDVSFTGVTVQCEDLTTGSLTVNGAACF